MALAASGYAILKVHNTSSPIQNHPVAFMAYDCHPIHSKKKIYFSISNNALGILITNPFMLIIATFAFPFFRRPSQFRALAVDPQVRSPDGRSHDVLFVGTTAGRILKIVNTAGPNDQDDWKADSNRNAATAPPTLVEEIVAFRSDVTIESLKVVRNSLESAPRLVALTANSVVSLPLARCRAADTCGSCVALRDPYCAWDAARGVCADTHGRERMDTVALAQSVTTGAHRKCKEEETRQEEPSHSSVLLGDTNSRNSNKESDKNDDENRVRTTTNLGLPSLVEDVAHYTAEELSMAVATSCVCALVVGFITGFLLARRCSCSREDENPYHVPYLNQ